MYLPVEGEPVIVEHFGRLAGCSRGVVLNSDSVPFPGFKVRLIDQRSPAEPDGDTYWAHALELRPVPFV